MRMKAVVAGVGMTRFGKHLETGLKALGVQALRAAIDDAGVDAQGIEAAYVANAVAGLMTGQESIRGQVMLRSMGLGCIPVVNVENACGSGSTAFNQAAAMVSAGCYDVVAAVGMEKLYHPDKAKSFAVFSAAFDVEELASVLQSFQPDGAAGASSPSSRTAAAGTTRSMAMDFYADLARRYMRDYGLGAADFAAVSAKNSFHGSLNPRAQFRESLSVQEVLAAPMIAEPLTRPMCSPIGDGAAAVILVSERKARELDLDRPVSVVSSVLRSGFDHGEDERDVATVCAREAYEEAGVGPEDLSVIELHDASAAGELSAYLALGLCAGDDAGRFVSSGETRLGGRVPVNTSGGLLRKGHPVGATGLAQVVELTEQLQGRLGPRQVESPTVALAHNGGGIIGKDAAAMCVSILMR